ncbi:MAG: hypothetical protein ACO1OA_04210, partial [Paracoccus marcusii]
GTEVIVRSQAESVAMEGPMQETPEGYVVPAAAVQPTADPAATAQVASAPMQTAMVASAPVESAVPTGFTDPYAAMTAVPAATSVQPSLVSDPFATDAGFVSPVESAVPSR